MERGQQGIAQAFYIAQLQACKGNCKCRTCEILRKSADLMSEEVLSSNPGNVPKPEDMVSLLKSQGYDITEPPAQRENDL